MVKPSSEHLPKRAKNFHFNWLVKHINQIRPLFTRHQILRELWFRRFFPSDDDRCYEIELGHYGCLPLLQASCFVSMGVTTIRRPCFCPPMPFLLHSHSMTSVKRTSSFHENSHSTRTRSWANRRRVTRNVSKSSETMPPFHTRVTRMTPVAPLTHADTPLGKEKESQR